MQQARVNTATVGVFSWSWIEPSEGHYCFDWLDATFERLHEAGVSVILATPTASPPPWFSLAHPDALPVRADGTRLAHGSRDTYCAAAPSYRQAAVRVATKLAERYAGHPALAMWHVHNEYGTRCWCDHAAAAFRSWLQQRYGPGRNGLDELNHAWGTAFWSQRYGDWEEVLPPRATQWLANPSQTLDFQRFWSSELLSSYVEQRDAVRAHAPGIPVTTNFMLPEDPVLDLWEWARAVDVVAIDHYPSSRGSGAYDQIALAGDLARSLNQGRPWVVMEQAASTTVEGHGTVHRPPGRTLLDALAYIAHGSDSALFFQWRASRAGAEMYHSAMVPHAGADTRIFTEMKILGQALEGMAEVCGSTLAAEVAIVFDFSSWWALEARRVLPAPVRYLDGVGADHRAVTRAGHLCDFVPPDGDLSRYKLVIVSSTYVLSDKAAQRMSQYVHDGGCMIVSYLSGVVGSSGTVGLGGYPAVLRSLLGVRVEEFHPLAPGEMVPLSGGGSGSLWSERLTTADADVVDRYETGDLAGGPAITRRPAGKGCAWYVSTRLCDERNDLLVSDALAVAGVPVAPKLGPAVHGLLRRDGAGRSWQFWLNYGGTSVQLPGDGYDLLSQRLVPAGQELRPGEAAVVRQDVSR